MGSDANSLGWVRFFLLPSPGSVLFTKSGEQLFLGWELGCSMIHENLCLDPKLKEERGNICASPVPKILQRLPTADRPRLECLGWHSMLFCLDLTSNLNILSSQNSVLSLIQWVLPIFFPATLPTGKEHPSLLSAELKPFSLEDPAQGLSSRLCKPLRSQSPQPSELRTFDPYLQ